jgi:hypothetical protein
MPGNRKVSGRSRQLSEQILRGTTQLRDYRNPGRYSLYMRFPTLQKARRFANRMEEHYRKTKIIEVIDHSKKPLHYLVYLKIKEKTKEV